MYNRVINIRLCILFVMYLSLLFSDRGDLISVEVLSTRDLVNTQTYIDAELQQIVSDMFSIDPAKYGFWLYKINYETIDVKGEINIASGTVAYPRVDFPDIPNQAFPLISYQHGTVVEKSSVTSINGEWILPAILTGAGYVYLEPDYLGLGDSEGYHPYQIKEPYGTVGVDMIRAVKEFAYQDDKFMLNDQIFLAGYSEGGYATMAMHQIIERDYSDEFVITASAPMAGAYSMSEVMVNVMLAQNPYGEPFYFPYTLFSYLKTYPDIGTSEQYLLPEYIFLEEYFDGYHSSAEINSVMPSIPITIMKPDEIENFEQDANHPLRDALAMNDLWDWYPVSPIYIFHGIGDELVPYENAQIAYNQLVLNGSQNVFLETIPENFGGHQDVAPWALFGAYQIFKDIMRINDLGDLNNDGGVNVLDVVILSNCVLMQICLEIEYGYLADMNSDGGYNVLDVVSLVNIVMNS